MMRWILGGIEAVRDSAKPAAGSTMDWRPVIREDGSADYTSMTPPMVAGYYWCKVAKYRQNHGLPQSRPDGKLFGVIANLMQTTDVETIIGRINYVVENFDSIRFQAGGAGRTLALDEIALTHRIVLSAIESVASMTKGELAKLNRDFNRSINGYVRSDYASY